MDLSTSHLLMASQQTLIIFAYLKIRFCITSNNYFWYWNTGFFLFLFFYFEQKENIISPSIIGQQKEKKIIPGQTYITRRNEKAVMCIWRAHACSALTSESRLFFSPLTQSSNIPLPLWGSPTNFFLFFSSHQNKFGEEFWVFIPILNF